MNCMLEALASVWLSARRRVMTEPPEEEVMTAQEGLEQCRRNMQGRERELLGLVAKLADEALAKKRQGDVLAARSRVLERRRAQKRLERLRHGLDLVDTQLDAIKTSELDKEIMMTLKASTNAMRKAGITLGVQEVENVMSELDEQMREVQDITEVLTNPLNAATGMDEDEDVDAELELLDAVGGPLPVESQLKPPAELVSTMDQGGPQASSSMPPALPAKPAQASSSMSPALPAKPAQASSSMSPALPASSGGGASVEVGAKPLPERDAEAPEEASLG